MPVPRSCSPESSEDARGVTTDGSTKTVEVKQLREQLQQLTAELYRLRTSLTPTPMPTGSPIANNSLQGDLFCPTSPNQRRYPSCNVIEHVNGTDLTGADCGQGGVLDNHANVNNGKLGLGNDAVTENDVPFDMKVRKGFETNVGLAASNFGNDFTDDVSQRNGNRHIRPPESTDIALKNSEFHDLKAIMENSQKVVESKRSIVRNLDLFVLDNSLRESTVGQLRGHTVENKLAILETIKKCGFKHIVVSAFSHVPRVDDKFVAILAETETDMSPFYAFSEVRESDDESAIPVGLRKMKMYRIPNPIFEIDLAQFDDEKTRGMCALLHERIEWSFDNLSEESRIFVNLRDFPYAMTEDNYENVFEVVKFLAELPRRRRPFGILFEEPAGTYLPEQLGAWTKALRILMDNHDWREGKILAHVHEKWSFANVTQLECLANGADGIWASVCEEGAALGHACSAITIMNLVRLGNTKLLKEFNCEFLRKAAIKVTEHTMGSSPHPRMPVYGERALDISFDFGKIAGGLQEEGDFDMAKFFGVKAPTRISTLASTKLVKDRLVELFGPQPQFTEQIANRMKEVMIQDLTENRKEEYMSEAGLAILFDRADGKLTQQMGEIIGNVALKRLPHQLLLDEVRQIWDEWDNTEAEAGDNCLEFYSFYNGFMAPYFGCYECDIAKRALQAIDMDVDNKVDWFEFLVYLKWALHQYPDIKSTEELLATAFQKGLIPAMQDEVLKKKTEEKK